MKKFVFNKENCGKLKVGDMIVSFTTTRIKKKKVLKYIGLVEKIHPENSDYPSSITMKEYPFNRRKEGKEYYREHVNHYDFDGNDFSIKHWEDFIPNKKEREYYDRMILAFVIKYKEAQWQN